MADSLTLSDDKVDLAEDFRAAVAQIAAAYPGQSRKRVQEFAAQLFGRTVAQLLFRYEPLGEAIDLNCENRVRSLEFIADAIAANPVFRNQREEARCAAIALGAFKTTYDDLVADFFKTGGRA